MVAAGEVGASDATLKEGVAAEDHAGFPAIQGDAARGMSRHLQHLEFQFAHCDYVALTQVYLHVKRTESIRIHAEHLRLFAAACTEHTVAAVGLGFQAVGIRYPMCGQDADAC